MRKGTGVLGRLTIGSFLHSGLRDRVGGDSPPEQSSNRPCTDSFAEKDTLRRGVFVVTVWIRSVE